ncbi:MAG: response regulator [Ignavibacteriae bacterium]|nr:response regulator [Ignavibacteriota bacterium]
MPISSYAVLIVEDEPTFRRFLEFQLRNSERFHFEIMFAASAEAGLALLEEHTFDFILLDYFLPGMNGEMFLKQLDRKKITSGIICISENKEYKIAVDLLKAGADDYISKSDLLSPYMLEKTIVSVSQKKEFRLKNSELEISAQRLDAIQTIIHTIDHELNNPLAIIKLCSDIINSSHPLRTDDYKDLTQRILTSMERVTQVIHKLNRFDAEAVNNNIMGPKIYALPEVA